MNTPIKVLTSLALAAAGAFPAAESRLAVEPYVCAPAAGDGRPVPLYGLTLHC